MGKTTSLSVDITIVLEERFHKNQRRHKGIEWNLVLNKLNRNSTILKVLIEMERTGGEPDVITNSDSEAITYYDCSKESPIGRRSLCYDREAFDSRSKNRPIGNAIEMASSIGIEILNEQQYREMQKYDEFDTKTSSWIKTPLDIRKLGGSLFADRRYNKMFVYHKWCRILLFCKRF